MSSFKHVWSWEHKNHQSCMKGPLLSSYWVKNWCGCSNFLHKYPQRPVSKWACLHNHHFLNKKWYTLKNQHATEKIFNTKFKEWFLIKLLIIPCNWFIIKPLQSQVKRNITEYMWQVSKAPKCSFLSVNTYSFFFFFFLHQNINNIPIFIAVKHQSPLEHQASYPPHSKFHGANMWPIWGRQDPGGPHVGPMNFAIWARFIYNETQVNWVVTNKPHGKHKIQTYSKQNTDKIPSAGGGHLCSGLPLLKHRIDWGICEFPLAIEPVSWPAGNDISSVNI